jgi:ABC-type phosphate transport system ATPase subunit
MWEPLKFKHPFTCIISGPSGSGKSTFCIKLLYHLNTLCTETQFKGGIIWCFIEETAVPREQLAKFGRSIPKEYGNARGEASLIILDDLLN